MYTEYTVYLKVTHGCFHGSNHYYLLYNAEDLKTLLEVCVKANVHVHTHTRKEVREESLNFCDVCTVYENIDGPQGGGCTVL